MLSSTRFNSIDFHFFFGFYLDKIFMSQSQGYKRFRSSIKTIHQGTSTPQTSSKRIFPRASTPNRRSIERFQQPTMPVIQSPRATVVVPQKIHKKRRQHRSKHQFQIHIDHIILVQQQKRSCSRCHCKKDKSPQILGVL